MKVILESERLVIREFMDFDGQNFFNLNKDKKVLLYTGDQPFKNVKEAEKVLEEKILAPYRAGKLARWAVHLRANGLFIGWCGFRELDSGEVDLGFRYMKRFWNKGFGLEAAGACLDYGWEELGLEQVIGRCMKENVASRRIFEKLDFEFVGEMDFDQHAGLQYIKKKPN